MDRRFFLRALSAASFWSFLFDGEPDYWPATIIGSYTPGMGATPTYVYLRHRQ